MHSQTLQRATLFALLAASASGQGSLLQFWAGKQSADRLGWSLAGPGDLDGDGLPDVLIGVPFDPVDTVQKGSLQARSGASGLLIYELLGDAALDHAGWSLCALGDIDFDGRGDFAYGVPDSDNWSLDAGMVRAVSGATGTAIYEWQGSAVSESFGFAVASAGDVSGDGRQDLLIGAYRAAALGALTGRVELRATHNGGLIRTHVGSAAGDRFGIAVAGLGDINGDGRAEYAVGADQQGTGPGYVRVYSGATGLLVRQHVGGQPAGLFGAALAAAGDVNLDGVIDLAIGVPRAADGLGVLTGAIELRSGKTGALLWTAFGVGAGAELGRALAGGPDLDGDARADLLAGAPLQAGTGVVSVRSGLDGAPLRTFAGESGGDRFGFAVAWVGDLDLDGLPDLAVGAPREDPVGVDSGTLRIFSGDGACGVVNYCTAKLNSQGCLPTLSWSGSPTLSGPDDLVVHASSVLNNKPGILIYGNTPAALPLMGGLICIGPPLLRSSLLLSGGNPPPDDCSGELDLALTHAFFALHGWGAGTRVVVQMWSRDPAHPDGTGASLSDALDFLLCP